MCTTLLLLGAQYIVLIGILVAAGIGVVAVAAIAAAALLVQYFSCERIILAAMRAQQVDAGQAAELHAITQRLCVTANLPMPRLAVVDSVMPDAYTVGRTPSTATVCATSALLALLDEDELEAVVAHELTHIITRDVTVMTIGSFFAAIAAHIARVQPPIARRDDDEAPPWWLAVILSGLVFMLSYVLIQSLSRHRELVADRGAAALTGRPGSLRSALERISDHAGRIPRRDLRDVPGEITPLGIVAADIEATVATLFSTHPPLRARLDALAHLEHQLPAGV
jgi:heat shock protein HtpX